MNGPGWWLVERISRTLARDERDAVMGDLAESGVSGTRALGDLLSLVLRRQAALWSDWRPWLCLFGLVGLAGILITRQSILDSNMIAMYREYKSDAGLTWRLAAGLTWSAFILMFRSWSAGFALGSLAGRTVWINGALFFIPWVWLELSGLHPPHGEWSVLEGSFNRLVIPLAVQVSVFLLPSLLGMRQGLRFGTLRGRTAILLTATIVCVAVLQGWAASGYARGNALYRLIVIIELALGYWPVWYLLFAAVSHRRELKRI